MDLYSSIGQRKSCRDYTTNPLPQNLLQEMSSAIEGFRPLYPDVPLRHRIVPETKGLFHVQAPQYLIVSGGGRQGELENAGFLYQQLALWLDAKGLGCVWLGKARDAQGGQKGDIITLAFGETRESPHRKAAEFKRKPIGDATNAPKDARMQAVHLAPSGMNLQPWYMERQEARVLVYEQKPKGPSGLLYKLSDLDMGIALCHYWLTCEHLGKTFAFKRTRDGAVRDNQKLFGEILEG